MQIFISWSGDRSEKLAKALHSWLPIILQYTKPWLSQADIESGKRWNSEVAKKLDECNFGIICITRENLNAPWVLFEAGALAKSIDDSRVVPLLLGMDFKDISGPLSQFQAKKTEKDNIKELVFDINKTAPSPVDSGVLQKLFDALYPNFHSELESIPDHKSTPKPKRTEGDILEELVATVRGLESRVMSIGEIEYGTRQTKRKIDARLIDYIHSLKGSRHNDKTRARLALSAFRTELPWLYDMGIESLDVITSRDVEDAERGMYFIRMLQDMSGTYIGENRAWRELLHIIEHEFIRLFDNSRERALKTKSRMINNLERDIVLSDINVVKHSEDNTKSDS